MRLIRISSFGSVLIGPYITVRFEEDMPAMTLLSMLTSDTLGAESSER